MSLPLSTPLYAESIDKTATSERQQKLIEQAKLFCKQNNYFKAIDNYKAALVLSEQFEDKVNIADALAHIGEIYYLLSNYTQAMEYLQKSFLLAKQIDNKQLITEISNKIGLVHYALSDYAQALEHFQMAMELAKEFKNIQQTSEALRGIGLIYLSQGNYAVALEYFQKSLKLANELDYKIIISPVLRHIGSIYLQQGNHQEALSYFNKSLKIGEEENYSSQVVGTLLSIGNVYYIESDCIKALEYFERALKISEKIGYKQKIIDALNNIGLIHYSQSNYTKAFESFQRSLKLAKEVGDPHNLALTMHNIGMVFFSQYNFAQALEYYQKSLEIDEKLKNKLSVGNTLQNIGLIHSLEGNYTEALKYYEKSLSIANEIGHKQLTNNAFYYIGWVYQSQSNESKALEYFQKSLDIAEQLSNKKIITLSLINMAKIYCSQNNSAKAIEFSNRAITLVAQMSDQDELLKEVYLTAGKVYRSLNQSVKAHQALLTSIDAIERINNQVVGEEQETERFFEGNISSYHEMIDLLISENNIEEAFSYAERSKGRVLLNIFRKGQKNLYTLTKEEQEQERKFNREVVLLNTKLYNEKILSNPNEGYMVDLNSKLQKARLQYEAFRTSLSTLNSKVKTTNGGYSKPLSLEEANTFITSKEALVEFVITEGNVYLFVLTKKYDNQSTVDLKFYPLDLKLKELTNRVETFSQLIASRNLAFSKYACDLYDLLFKSVQQDLQNKTSLIIVPDGVLWKLPFQALQSSKNRFLLEDYIISYVPSLTVLYEMTKHRTEQPNFSTNNFSQLLAFGNPVFNAKTNRNTGFTHGNELLPALPEAEKEVNILKQIYGRTQSRVYIRAEASEEKAKLYAGDYQILHFATHSVFNNYNPMYSQIVLAQVNNNSKEDGLLEAWEIMRMNLKAKLVILSACETARGRFGEGEGIIGLTWALLVAGCPTTVVSQWKVESSSTSKLMIEFHRNIKASIDNPKLHISKASALREAALKLLHTNEYRHPFYWAGFIMVGDGI